LASLLSEIFKQIFPRHLFGLKGQTVELERPNRLAFKDGLKVYWPTVKTDGLLDGGVEIDIDTMNATDLARADEPRDKRIRLACQMHAFLLGKGYRCEIFEDGLPLHSLCNGSEQF
jgi:hypothetical protein